MIHSLISPCEEWVPEIKNLKMKPQIYINMKNLFGIHLLQIAPTQSSKIRQNNKNCIMMFIYGT